MSASSQPQKIPTIHTLAEIEKVTSQPSFTRELLVKLREGFVAFENGAFFSCPIQTMGLPPFPFAEVEGYAAQTCVKSGYFKGDEYNVIKVASGGYPMPNAGLMQVYSQRTGKLEVLLLDDGVLTEIRTAAAGALSTQLLAPTSLQKIGIVGSGVQARYQLRMLPHVTSCRDVLVWGRTVENVQAFSDDIVKEGWNIQVVNEADELLKECDLIITTTCSREPILGKDLSLLLSRKKKGLHITCIGADAPGKKELHRGLIEKADLLVADSIKQSMERGEFQNIPDATQRQTIISLGKLVETPELQRSPDGGDNRITIFDTSGVSLQDVIISQIACNALLKK